MVDVSKVPTNEAEALALVEHFRAQKEAKWQADGVPERLRAAVERALGKDRPPRAYSLRIAISTEGEVTLGTAGAPRAGGNGVPLAKVDGEGKSQMARRLHAAGVAPKAIREQVTAAFGAQMPASWAYSPGALTAALKGKDTPAPSPA